MCEATGWPGIQCSGTSETSKADLAGMDLDRAGIDLLRRNGVAAARGHLPVVAHPDCRKV